MRILVVGGAGYIGSHAVRCLLRAGHDVRVLDNLVYGHAGAVPVGLLFDGDLNDPAALEAALRAAGVGRIVFSSTCAVYGNVVPPIREDSPTNPINPYGFTKLAMERALADYASAYGLGFAALRYFNACGAAEDGSIGEDHQP